MRGPCEPTNKFKSPMHSCLISGRTFRKHAPQGCGRLRVDENYDMQRPSNGALISDPSLANDLWFAQNPVVPKAEAPKIKIRKRVKPCLKRQ